MLKHKGLKTLLTYSFLVIMMMINEAASSSLEILVTDMISELASHTSQCLKSSKNEVNHGNRKLSEPNEKDVKKKNINAVLQLWRHFLKLKF